MSDSERTIEEQADSPDGETLEAGARVAKAGARAAEGETSEPGAAAAHVADGGPGNVTRHPSARADGDAAEIEGDLDELVRTAAQRDEYLALAQRTQADFENYRKRVARESASAQARGVASLAKELLPALDNLDRALEAAAQDDPLLEGVRLVRSELKDALARVGVECFSPVGEPFDPALHEAMATTGPAADGADSGTVVEVYQPGYRLGASIIRPARVLVSS